MRPTVGVVVLSMGTRPVELRRALDTVLRQRDVDLDVLLVGNGWEPVDVPAGVRTLHLPENLGIPEGRNVGAAAVHGEFVLFYDDDAALERDDVLARLADEFEKVPRAAVVQPRGVDPQGRATPRRWVPRLRVTDGSGAPGDAVVFWEAVCLVRRAAFDAVGGWPGHFWYGHEGIDLALRLLDAGWSIRYRPDVTVEHPATAAQRHTEFYRMNARNRVWVARRNLPYALGAVYLTDWALLTALRTRDPQKLKVWWAGFAEGLRTDPGPRRPIGWRTVARLTAAGRPPII